MSAKYPLSIHRDIERRWAERIKSLKQVRGLVVAATERTLQHTFGNEGSLIPVRTIADRRQLDRRRPGD